MDGNFRLREQIEVGRHAADRRIIPEPEARCRRLKRMRALLNAHRDALDTALFEDLGRTPQANALLEHHPLDSFINALLHALPRLAKPHYRCTLRGAATLLDEPCGQVLIFAPWIQPLRRTLEPLLAAYAAGNRVVLKLPKRSNRTMQQLRWLLTECFTDDEVAVVDDEYTVDELLALRFDLIYGGGDALAQQVRQAAAERPGTTVAWTCDARTLCIVAPRCNLRTAARRIAEAKFTDAGQGNAAPDLVLVHRDLANGFTDALTHAVTKRFGQHPLDSAGCGRIIDAFSYERLSGLAATGRLLCGGEKSPASSKIAPTVLDRLPEDAPVLHELIEGPLLPVVSFSSEEELLSLLAKYGGSVRTICCFSGNRSLHRRVIADAASEAVEFNDVTDPRDRLADEAALFHAFSRPRTILKRGFAAELRLCILAAADRLVRLLNRVSDR